MKIFIFLLCGLLPFVVGLCDVHWSYADWQPGCAFYGVFAVLNISAGLWNMFQIADFV